MAFVVLTSTEARPQHAYRVVQQLELPSTLSWHTALAISSPMKPRRKEPTSSLVLRLTSSEALWVEEVSNHTQRTRCSLAFSLALTAMAFRRRILLHASSTSVATTRSTKEWL